MKINSFDSLLKLQTDWEYVIFFGKIYSSVGRKYSTGPILPSDGQIE